MRGRRRRVAACLAGDGAERLLGKAEVDALHLEQPLGLLDQGILRLKQNGLERRLVEIAEGGDHRQAPNEFRDQAVLQAARGFGRHGSDIRRSSCPIRKIAASVGSRPRRPSLKPDHNLIGKFPSATARRATIFALSWPSPALSNPDH
jgi:hypothetical protein